MVAYVIQSSELRIYYPIRCAVNCVCLQYRIRSFSETKLRPRVANLAHHASKFRSIHISPEKVAGQGVKASRVKLAMDPLTAFSLACNVITVVDTAVKCGKTVVELYDSTDGYTRDSKAVLKALGDWETIETDLETAEAQVPRTPLHKSLHEAAVDCLRISRQIKDILVSCRAYPSGSWISATKGMLKVTVKKSKISQLSNQLEQSALRVTSLVAAATR